MKAGVDYEAITVDEHASILRSTEYGVMGIFALACLTGFLGFSWILLGFA